MKRIVYILFSIVLLCSLLIAGCQPAPTPAEEAVLNLYGIDNSINNG